MYTNIRDILIPYHVPRYYSANSRPTSTSTNPANSRTTNPSQQQLRHSANSTVIEEPRPSANSTVIEQPYAYVPEHRTAAAASPEQLRRFDADPWLQQQRFVGPFMQQKQRAWREQQQLRQSTSTLGRHSASTASTPAIGRTAAAVVNTPTPRSQASGEARSSRRASPFTGRPTQLRWRPVSRELSRERSGVALSPGGSPPGAMVHRSLVVDHERE